jgi:DNA-binding protein H-NS
MPALQPAEKLAAESTAVNLDLSYLELKALHAEIGELLAQRETEARQMFKADFIAKMHEYGMSLDDLKPEKPKKERKTRDLPVKYRDPDNPENTWSGVGKPKKWLQERLDQGHTLDLFAVGTVEQT